MLVTLIGPTCSGKSYYTDKFVTEGNMKKLKEFTTRPKRSGESEDAYYFISEETFFKLREKERVYMYTSFDVASDETWYYGIFQDDFEEAVKSKETFILPTNIDTMPKGKNITNCIIDIDYKTLAKRIIDRGDLEETIRRSLDDIRKIESFKTEVKIKNNFGETYVIVGPYMDIADILKSIEDDLLKSKWRSNEI